MAIVRTTNQENNSGDESRGDDKLNGKTERVAKTSAAARNRASGKASTRIERARSAANRSALATQGSSPGDFLRDTQAELKRVVWPTKEVVTSGTIVTIGMLVFFAVYIFALNLIAENLLSAIGLISTTK